MNANESGPIRAIGQIAASISEALQIEDLDRSDPLQFWKSVAIALAGNFEGSTPAEIASWLISERFDRDWDPEEMLDDETGFPGTGSYEEILDIANQVGPSGPDEEGIAEDVIASDDEEEAGSDALAEMHEDIAYASQDLAVETLLARIHRNVLIISPAWQRSYVWKSKRKKRFVESLLIGLPIASILTWYDQNTRTEYIIDGRQRLETLLRFCSSREQLQQLQIEERPFKTFTSKEPLFAPGRQLNPVANKRFDQFPPEWQNQLLGQTFHMVRFGKLKARQLYQVFERYNTGGVQLQAQEIRNAVYQRSPLHRHLWSLAREYSDPKPDPDEGIDRVAADLRSRMDRKADRYGVYSFVGRVFAFAYFQNRLNPLRSGSQSKYVGTVASATNDFMEDYESIDWETLRRDWIRMYDKTIEWYTSDFALVRPTPTKVLFHAFLATVQLATTHHLIRLVEEHTVEEDAIAGAIRSKWRDFAFNDPEVNSGIPIGIALSKQNSTHFWSSQRRWLDLIHSELGISGASGSATL